MTCLSVDRRELQSTESEETRNPLLAQWAAERIAVSLASAPSVRTKGRSADTQNRKKTLDKQPPISADELCQEQEQQASPASREGLRHAGSAEKVSEFLSASQWSWRKCGASKLSRSHRSYAHMYRRSFGGEAHDHAHLNQVFCFLADGRLSRVAGCPGEQASSGGNSSVRCVRFTSRSSATRRAAFSAMRLSWN